jgi:tetratricopeptide (TPR) repeat protein
VEVLRAEPDTDTVRALGELASLEFWEGSPDADLLTTEALTLGQALDAGPGQLADLLVTRGLYLDVTGRHIEAVAYLREAARLAEDAGDTIGLGRVLIDLSAVLGFTDPAAAAEAARTAAGHLRRAGHRVTLAYAIMNLVTAMVLLGDWDAAGEELTQAMDSGGLVSRSCVP